MPKHRTGVVEQGGGLCIAADVSLFLSRVSSRVARKTITTLTHPRGQIRVLAHVASDDGALSLKTTPQFPNAVHRVHSRRAYHTYPYAVPVHAPSGRVANLCDLL